MNDSKNFLNYYTPLRQYFHEQSNLCPYLLPTFVNATIPLANFLSKKSQSQKKYYFTSYWIQAFSKTLNNHPQVNASFVRKGIIFRHPHIESFSSVAAAVSIDKTLAGERFPFTYVFPHSDQMTIAEIDERLDFVVRSRVEDIPEFQQFLQFVRFPALLKKIIFLHTTLSSERMQKRMGTFNLSNVAKWGFQQTYVPCPRLLVAVNFCQDDILNISYSFNHIIIDGAQIGDYHRDVKKFIENFEFE